MDFDTLYKQAVLMNIVGWNVATEPTEDSYLVEEMVSISFNKALKEFIDTNPNHKLSIFNKETIIPEHLVEKRIQVSQKLWKKYLALREVKAPADEEYFTLFDAVVKINQEVLKEKGLSPTNSLFLNDNRLGSEEFIFMVVEKLANISKEFLQAQPKNQVIPLKAQTFEEIISFVESFNDLTYKVSNKNGSFMTGLDKDNSRIHINKSDDMFDVSSSVTHEVGHALYQNRVLNKNTEVGKITQMISLSLHESSSIIHEIALSGIDFNVKKNNSSLFRLACDKVHYIIHIYIRMKIEALLFNNQITAKEIPNVWNDLVEEYIGIRPQHDWEGFLQDVHWNSTTTTGSSFGYFHSYAIGFFHAVLMLSEIKDKLTGNMAHDTEDVILPKIQSWYGNYNEDSFNILENMHPDIEKSIATYKSFIFNNFTYSD